MINSPGRVRGYICVVSPGTPTGSHDEKQTNGISYNHAFTILGTKEVTDAAGTKTKLVKIRNPWGAEEYKGDWSDSSTKWTPALRTQAGSVVKNDGEFFIPVADLELSKILLLAAKLYFTVV